MLTIWWVWPYADKTFEHRKRLHVLKLLREKGVARSALLTNEFSGNRQLHSLWHGQLPVIKTTMGPWAWWAKLGLALKLLNPRMPADMVMLRPWSYWKKTIILSKWLFRKPYVVWLDSYAYEQQSNLKTGIYHELRYGLLLRNADLIIAETPYCCNIARERLPHKHILQIPVSLDIRALGEVEAQWARQGQKPQRQKTTLFVGRISSEKHPDDLLEAFAEIHPDFPEWKIKIVGPNIDKFGKPDLKLMRRLETIIATGNLAECVEIIPGLYGEDLYRAYAESSIYVLPSEGEGVPSTVLEAMYFGGAIIATRTGCVPWMLDEGQCGKIIPIGDKVALRETLRSLMNDPEEQTCLTHAARSRVLERFSWEQNVNALIPELEFITRKYHLN